MESGFFISNFPDFSLKFVETKQMDKKLINPN